MSWAPLTTVSDMLQAADSVERISFYVIKHENKPAELHCRCFSMPGMDKAGMEALAVELNTAITPVTTALKESLAKKAANQLRRFL